MALTNSQYDEIFREYNRRQIRNKHLLDAHKEEAYRVIPRLAEIDHEIGQLALKKAHASLAGDGQDFDLNSAINERSEERIILLTAYGYPADYLEMHYDCPKCKDTGRVGTQKCSCFKKAAVELLYIQSNIRDILKTENFEHFNLDYYPTDVYDDSLQMNARQAAQAAIEKAMDFIRNFETDNDNLFLYGDPGIGKTFLSHCIARELIDASCFVLYFSAYDLFEMLAQQKFYHEEDEQLSAADIFSCDLLIIDDLGTELTNQFVISQLFLCINERLARKKSTIISTNLTLEEFSQVYSERIFSRVYSNFTLIKLIGNDIRIIKKLKGGTH